MTTRSEAARQLAEVASSDTAFKIVKGGGGIAASWKVFGLCLGAAFALGGIYWTLMSHGTRLDTLTGLVSSDHDILVELRAYAKAGEHARNEGSGSK